MIWQPARSTARIRPLLSAIGAAGLLAGCGIGTSPQQALARADRNLAARNYRAATVDLENLVARQPDDPGLRLKLARALYHTGAYAESEASFRRAQQLGAAWPALTTDLAEVLLAEGQPQQALDLLSAHPPAAALDARTSSVRGRALLALQRLDDAHTALTQAVALDAGDMQARIALAQLLGERGDPAGAKSVLDAAAAAAPSDFAVHLALGAWYLAASRVREAHAELTRALDLAVAGIRGGSEPGYDEFRALAPLVDTDLMLGDLASAKQHLARVRKLAPHASVTSLLEARIDLAEKRTDEARALLQNLLNREPQNEPAKVLLGVASAAAGELGQADMYLSSALAANPRDLSARKLLTQVQLQERKPQDALKTATDPNAAMDADLLALAGRASVLAGDLSGATQYLERSEEAAPQDKVRALDLAQAYLADNRAGDALKLLQRTDVPASLADRRELLLLTALSRTDSAAGLRDEAERFVAAHPQDAEALLIGARARVGLKDLSGARGLIDQAAKLDPRSSRPWVALGALELSQNDRAGADAAFRHALQVDARSVGAQLGEAQLALASGDRDEAIRRLEQARSDDPRSLPARLGLARLYLLRGEAQQAAQPLAEARRIAPDHPNVLLLLGTLALAQNDATRAVELFERLSARYPQSAILQADLARAYGLARRPDDALKASAEAVRLDPGYWPALALETRLALEVGDRSSVSHLLERLRSSKAPPAAVETVEGDVAARGGNFAQALRDYTSAATAAPSAELALKITAVQHALHATDPDAPLRAWLQRAPNDVRVRLALAQYLQSAGDRGGAAREYQTVLDTAPTQVVALNNLAWLRLEAGQKEAALGLAREAYGAAPNQASVADTFGWALVQTGNAADAVPVLRAAHGAAPDAIEIHLHFAIALLKGGDTDDARRELQSVASAQPHGPIGDQARALLAGVASTAQR